MQDTNNKKKVCRKRWSWRKTNEQQKQQQKNSIRNSSNEAFHWSVSSIIYRICAKSLLIYKQWIDTRCDSISFRLGLAWLSSYHNAKPRTFTNRQVKMCWVWYKWTKIIDSVVYILIFFNNTLWNNGLAVADFQLWIVIFCIHTKSNLIKCTIYTYTKMGSILTFLNPNVFDNWNSPMYSYNIIEQLSIFGSYFKLWNKSI